MPIESVNSWIDLVNFLKKRPKYKNVAFIHFDYGVDGVTIEMIKYARVIKEIYGCNIHWIAGKIDPKFRYFRYQKKLIVNELKGFDDWKPYHALYHSNLHIDSPEYKKAGKETLDIANRIYQKLKRYFFNNDVDLIHIANIGSLPANISATIAMVLLSRHIPVISSNHDFYFEKGKRGRVGGPRDHYFKNFKCKGIRMSIQKLFPYHGRNWVHMNINKQKTSRMLRHGFSRKKVMEVTTAVDLDSYPERSKTRALLIRRRLNKFLEKYNNFINVRKKFNLADLRTPFVLGTKKSLKKKVTEKTTLFLHPTRVFERKRIEKDIDLLEKLIKNRNFKKDDVALLISGPVPVHSNKYYVNLIEKFKAFAKKSDIKIIFALGFFKDESSKAGSRTVLINEAYLMSDLVLFPSETEGRGLPLIESAAAKVPIVTTHYKPKRIFKDVVGENLKKTHKLRVIEWPEGEIPPRVINTIVDILTNEERYNDIVDHNRKVVKRRFSFRALKLNYMRAFQKLNAF